MQKSLHLDLEHSREETPPPQSAYPLSLLVPSHSPNTLWVEGEENPKSQAGPGSGC